MLSVVWSVDLLTLAVLAWTGVVTPNDKVCSTVVLANDGVPESLTGTTHAHGKRQQTQNSHSVGVARQESLVDTHSSKMVNVAGLGKTNDRVDEDVGLSAAGSADSQLTVSAVHGVTGLESDDTGPAELVEVQAQLSGGVAQADVVVVHQTVDGVNLASDVVLAGRVEEVLDSRVVGVAAEDLLGLLVPRLLSDCAMN